MARLARLSADFWAGVVVAVLGVAYTVIALQIPPGPSQASVIGPSYAPVFLGVVLTLLGLALAALGTRGPVRGPGEVAEGGGDRAADHVAPRHRLWVILGIFAVYIWAFIPVGYLLSTAAFLLALTSYFNPRQWRSNVLYAVLFPVVVLLLFEYALNVPLPEGLLRGVLP